jgi:hypothetical protein
MESQAFSPADYSVNATDLISDDFEDDNDVAWLEYCRCGVSVNLLYGFEQCNVQNTSRHMGIRHCSSPDDLVGLEEEDWGNGEAEGLSGLEVDDQFNCHRLLHRQIPWFGPFEDFVHVCCRTSVSGGRAQPIEHDGTLLHPPPPIGSHHREPALRCDGQDLFALRVKERKWWHEECFGRHARQRRQGGVQCVGIADVQQVQLYPQHPSRARQFARAGSRHRMGRMHEDGHAGSAGHGFLEQRELFPNELRVRTGDPL